MELPDAEACKVQVKGAYEEHTDAARRGVAVTPPIKDKENEYKNV